MTIDPPKRFYAIVNDQGYTVGCYSDRRLAESVLSRGQPSHNEKIIELCPVSEVAEIKKGGIGLIAAERNRQISGEGWTVEHDDEHDAGELASAGAAYALNAACVLYPYNGTPLEKPPEFWMWDYKWWKPKDPFRDLARAGALIAAEIDRMLREKV